MDAVISYIFPQDGAEIVDFNNHSMQFGHGHGGDGYCYTHQSFDCIDNLTIEERHAVFDARYPGVFDLEVVFNRV